MSTPSGIFVLGEFTGPAAQRIREITLRTDPKLGRSRPPHVTVAGSSGVGPIHWDTPVEELDAKLRPITESTPPLSLVPLAPHRFAGTDIVVLPFDPHGPLRVLHDRIAASGLRFEPPRFTFSPHVTLNLYRTLTRETLQALLRERIETPLILNTLQVHYTNAPSPSRLLLELPLTGDTV